MIFRKLIAGVLLVVAPSYSMACSCFGISSIGEALSDSDDVIVGRILSTNSLSFDGDTWTPEGVEIEVLKALKGDLRGTVFVATMSLCYQSFAARRFKAGETYVLPLTPPSDWGDDADAISILPTPSTEPKGRWFELPWCSHSGLALIDGRLYTNDDSADEARLDYYMGLNTLELLLPLGLLNPIVAGALVMLAVVILIAIFWRHRLRLRPRSR